MTGCIQSALKKIYSLLYENNRFAFHAIDHDNELLAMKYHNVVINDHVFAECCGIVFPVDRGDRLTLYTMIARSMRGCIGITGPGFRRQIFARKPKGSILRDFICAGKCL
jgi:hypothetical protein